MAVLAGLRSRGLRILRVNARARTGSISLTNRAPELLLRCGAPPTARAGAACSAPTGRAAKVAATRPQAAASRRRSSPPSTDPRRSPTECSTSNLRDGRVTRSSASRAAPSAKRRIEARAQTPRFRTLVDAVIAARAACAQPTFPRARLARPSWRTTPAATDNAKHVNDAAGERASLRLDSDDQRPGRRPLLRVTRGGAEQSIPALSVGSSNVVGATPSDVRLIDPDFGLALLHALEVEAGQGNAPQVERKLDLKMQRRASRLPPSDHE